METSKLAKIKKTISTIAYIWAYITTIAFSAKAIVNLTLAYNKYNEEA